MRVTGSWRSRRLVFTRTGPHNHGEAAGYILLPNTFTVCSLFTESVEDTVDLILAAIYPAKGQREKKPRLKP